MAAPVLRICRLLHWWLLEAGGYVAGLGFILSESAIGPETARSVNCVDSRTKKFLVRAFLVQRLELDVLLRTKMGSRMSH